ncbi:MAG: sigma-70 family RNA polymerase sigma factor [Phycisphaerae bacterium]
MAELAPRPADDEIDALCSQARGGNADSLERLLWIHHDRLLEHARRKVGPDWHAQIGAEDVLQEAYIDVFGSIAEFEYRGADSFYHWAARIVDRRFIDRVRRAKAARRDIAREIRPADAAASRAALLQHCLAETATPSRFARHDEAVAILLSCLARLPDEYRIVIQRVHLDQQPVAAVAAELGRTEDAVRRLAGRAVDRLRELLARTSPFTSRAANL